MIHLSDLLHTLDHDAKPLLSAAAKYAETEGKVIVQEVEAEIKAKGPAELLTLFETTLQATFGFQLPVGTSLSSISSAGFALLTTAVARERALQQSGSVLRPSVINEGIEQAVLLLKAAVGDTKTAPSTPVF